jgi:hypothetical protein
MIPAFISSCVLFSSWNGILYLKASHASRSVQHRGPTQGWLATGEFYSLWRFQLKQFSFWIMPEGSQKKLCRLSCDVGKIL